MAEPPDGDQLDLLSDPDRVRPWRDLPEGFGNWKTIYNRHRRWSGDGTWQEILDRLRAAGCDEAEGKDWTLSADSTVVRAHQHAAGARRALPADLVTGAAANDKNPAARPGREALGCSRGGLSTKIPWQGTGAAGFPRTLARFRTAPLPASSYHSPRLDDLMPSVDPRGSEPEGVTW